MNRALRRHHRDRLIKKRIGYNSWMTENSQSSLVANTPCPCSCHGCRNPRHSHYYKGKLRLTNQERRAFEDMEHQLDLLFRGEEADYFGIWNEDDYYEESDDNWGHYCNISSSI